MFSLESFYKKYETDVSRLEIKGHSFKFVVPKDLDRFIDDQNVFNEFPLWTKVWEASIILADYLAGIAVEPSKRFLEIGSGLGIVGIIASYFGHRVTMTEYNSDAMHFARANARINQPSPDSNLKIMELDWNRPQMDELLDYIVGSEVIYKKQDYQSILRLFRKHLKPGGEIILAEGIRKTSIEFFKQMEQYFHIRAHKKTLRSKQKEIRVLLCKMRYK